MSLSSNQVLFVLKVLGRDWLYLGGPGFPGEDFSASFLREINNSLGTAAVKLALDAQVDYVQDQPVSKNNLPGLQIQAVVQPVGMRIPPNELVSSERALSYVQTYGSNYRSFSSGRNYPPQKWIEIEAPSAELSFNVLHPTLSGNDKFLDPFLRTHLRDLYTDYDLIERFPQLNLDQLFTRDDMINEVMKLYRPAGEFWFSFGFDSVRLEHQLGEETQSYRGSDQISALIQVEEAKVYFNGQEVAPVSLYQLALLVQPEYFKEIYGINPSLGILQLLWSLFSKFIYHIKILESQLGSGYRFTEAYSKLNFYLNQTEINPSPELLELNAQLIQKEQPQS